MRGWFWRLFFGVVLSFSHRMDAAIYVSPGGNDANPGTQSQPIQSLAHARELVRKIKNTGGLTVYLDGGTYRLSEPLVFDTADSGADGHDVIYTSIAGKEPIVSGAVRITGWKLSDAAKNLWSAPAPDVLKNTRQLYVNGVRALRSRGRLPIGLTKTVTGFTAADDSMSDWKNQADIEFVFTGGNAIWSEGSTGLGAWTEPRCPVERIEGTNIIMAQPCWNNSTLRVDLPAEYHSPRKANLVGPGSVGKGPICVENAFELLGTPGQWYFDRPAKTIYYVPRLGEDLQSADVEAPVLEQLVVVRGTPEAPVHNIIFSGIQFSYATWLFPSGREGFSEIQANYLVTGDKGYAVQGLADLAPGGTKPFGVWAPTPGNVAGEFDHDIQFFDDSFVHLGAAGLALGNGSQGDVVQGCVFTDISGNGLEIGNVDLPEADEEHVTRDNEVWYNHFYDMPVEFHGGVGICVGYAQRTDIRRNRLDHLPYSAISLGWGGWLDKIKRPGVANNSQDNVVANNLIYDHMQLLADGGAIYTQGLTGPSLQHGEKVTGNVIHDQLGSGHGIYSDNGSCYMTITGNVIFHTNFDNWGTAHADYYDGKNGSTRDPIAVENNYWQQGNPDSSAGSPILRGNRLISSLNQAPPAMLKNAGLGEDFEWLLKKRRFCSPAAPEPPERVAAASSAPGKAVVSWNPPIFQGTSLIRSYTVTSGGGQTATISADDFRERGFVEIAGLSGEKESFTVTAMNVEGSSSPSMPSGVIRLGGKNIQPPGAPVTSAVYPGDGMASLHFSLAEETGGSPVTAVRFTINPGGRVVTVSGRAVLVLGSHHVTFVVIDGLTNGTTYTIDAAAVNAAGAGAAATSKPVTPRADH